MKKLLILLMILLTACVKEPVDISYEDDCCSKYATITANNDFPNSRPNYTYNGDYDSWFISREWKVGDSFIITLESCDREIYYGKYIIQMRD
jgi:hypothetical protein